jgi:hypothetical protein
MLGGSEVDAVGFTLGGVVDAEADGPTGCPPKLRRVKDARIVEGSSPRRRRSKMV